MIVSIVTRDHQSIWIECDHAIYEKVADRVVTYRSGRKYKVVEGIRSCTMKDCQ